MESDEKPSFIGTMKPDDTKREILRLYNEGLGCVSIAEQSNMPFSKVIGTVRMENLGKPIRM